MGRIATGPEDEKDLVPTMAESRRTWGYRFAMVLLLGPFLLLGACESTEDDTGPVTASGQSAPEPDGPVGEGYPSLGSVPDHPGDVMTMEEWETLKEGLAADRDNARYVDKGPVAQPEPSGQRRNTETDKPQAAPETSPDSDPAPDVEQREPDEAPTDKASAADAGPPVANSSESHLSPRVSMPPSTHVRPKRPDTTNPNRPRVSLVMRPSADSSKAMTTQAAEPPAVSQPEPAMQPMGEPSAPEESESAADLPMALPKPARPVSEGLPSVSIQVATVYFGHSSSSLSQKDQRVLRQVSQLYKQSGGTIRVIGHASSRTRDLDPITHRMANFEMSIQRANKVARTLKRLGVEGSDLRVVAKGAGQPEYMEVMPVGEAGNRRVEIYQEF